MMMTSRTQIGLKLCSWNANGILNKKISEFKLFVEKYSLDLVLLQETNPRPSHTLNIPNYICYRNDHIGDGRHIEATVVIITPQNLNPIAIISVYVPTSSEERLFTLDLKNILQTNKNFAENKRPVDGTHPIDKEITNTLEDFCKPEPIRRLSLIKTHPHQATSNIFAALDALIKKVEEQRPHLTPVDSTPKETVPSDTTLDSPSKRTLKNLRLQTDKKKTD
ncbi:hypothetical protein TNCV_2509151 [Trichonephila clavipes]|nr:hypothetical protein TNCV_2509151 [Trichonephila clavipes]